MKLTALAILGLLLIPLMLSATTASATDVTEDIGVKFVNVITERTTNGVNIYIWWGLTDNAAKFSGLTVDISIDGYVLKSNYGATGHDTIGGAWQYAANSWSEKNYTRGTHTIKVTLHDLTEPANANKNNNYKERIVTVSEEWYKALADGYSFIAYGMSDVTQGFGWDLWMIVAIIAIVALIIVLVYFLFIAKI
jgi:hypothetical protein